MPGKMTKNLQNEKLSKRDKTILGVILILCILFALAVVALTTIHRDSKNLFENYESNSSDGIEYGWVEHSNDQRSLLKQADFGRN